MAKNEKLKQIVKIYGLGDTMFADEDQSTNTGETLFAPTDADVSLNAGSQDIVKQAALMRSAVQKIFAMYNGAYSKDTFRQQLDIYPMRDFDEYMATLGAKRGVNGIDFEPTEAPHDWIAEVKTDLKKRLAARVEQEKEALIKKAADLVDQKTETSTEAFKKSKELINTKLRQAKTDPDSRSLDVALQIIEANPQYVDDLAKGVIPPTLKSALSESDRNKLLAIISPVVLTPDEIVAEEKAKKEADEYKQGSTKLLSEVQAQIDKLKKQMEAPNVTGEEKTRLATEVITLKKQLEDASKNRSKLIAGIVVSQQQKDAMQKQLSTQFEREFNAKYDGYTTAGPFCIQKRDYFRNVYRPSIDHTDTEFREAIPTPVKSTKDEGNDIRKILHQKGNAPVVETSSTDPYSGGVNPDAVDPDNPTNKKEIKTTVGLEPNVDLKNYPTAFGQNQKEYSVANQPTNEKMAGYFASMFTSICSFRNDEIFNVVKNTSEAVKIVDGIKNFLKGTGAFNPEANSGLGYVNKKLIETAILNWFKIVQKEGVSPDYRILFDYLFHFVWFEKDFYIPTGPIVVEPYGTLGQLLGSRLNTFKPLLCFTQFYGLWANGKL